jgi:hypothetical protein
VILLTAEIAADAAKFILFRLLEHDADGRRKSV